MSSIYEDLQISYGLRPGITEADIEAYLRYQLLPEINRTVEEDLACYQQGISQESAVKPTQEDCYFEIDDALDEFYNAPATLEDLQKHRIEDGCLYLKAETENTQCHLTRYLAWKLFVEFGVGDTFVSTTISDDGYHQSGYRVTVTRDGRKIEQKH